MALGQGTEGLFIGGKVEDMLRALKIWWIYSKNSFQQIMMNRKLVILFTTAKILRILLFLIFLNFLLVGSKGLVGYSKEQVIFFYLTFTMIDTLTQLFFREVYRFRSLVVTGSLDGVLLKPINPLIRVLMGGMDLMDLGILVLTIAAVIYWGNTFITHDPILWLIYTLLVINGLLIAAAFHIFVLGFGIITTSVDHLIMVYRDLASLMRIPVNLYVEPIRFLLTFIIPLGMMTSFPPQVLMGLLKPELILLSFIISILALTLSYLFWKHSLYSYQGASS